MRYRAAAAFVAALVAVGAASAEAVEVTADNGRTLILDERNFYVDGEREASEAQRYVFATLHQAVAAASDGTEAQPMTIYLEPDVYQMRGTERDRGLYIDKDWVSLIGLSEDPRDVVLADNRGHTIGAHSTSGSSPAETLYVTGTGFHAENLTIGNYCNLDLVYPRDPSKNQPKRSSTITQAYAIGASNPDKRLDKFSFFNVRFIGMLDTLALADVSRVYFDRVFVQGTDDFIGGGDMHVFHRSTIRSFTSKPLFSAGRHGTAFIDSTWEVDFNDPQDLMLSKQPSTLFLINTRFEDVTGKLQSIRWSPRPAQHVKSYTHNVTLDGQPYVIVPSSSSTQLTASQASAYTAYNLLKGSDGWNPAGAKSSGDKQPLKLTISEGRPVRAGEGSVSLQAAVYPPSAPQKTVWRASSDQVELTRKEGRETEVRSRNSGEQAVSVEISVTAANGLTNQTVVTALPALTEPPAFTRQPVVTTMDHHARVDYALDLAYDGGVRPDHSRVTWYRVDDASGTNPVPVAVSRDDNPQFRYTPGPGDVGHYLMARVQPKHRRSALGAPVSAITQEPVQWHHLQGEGVNRYDMTLDPATFPTSRQPQLIPGSWTRDTYYPHDQSVRWQAEAVSGWDYGTGVNGAAETTGLMTVAQGARLLYPQPGRFGDMRLHLELDTEKTAAQGFGSPNGQYMEIYIKYDPVSQTGYALRIERTPKYSFATDFTLYQYEQGKGKPLTKPVAATAFNPGTSITLGLKGDELYAEVTTRSEQSNAQRQAGLPNKVMLSTKVEGNSYGGVGIQHTGTVGPGGRTVLKALSVDYDS